MSDRFNEELMANVVPHPYTVDVYLHGTENYPCTVCGELRNAEAHRRWQEADEWATDIGQKLGLED